MNRIVSAYLDLAESNTRRQILMKMSDWTKLLNGFLELARYPILKDKSAISAIEAKNKAINEYKKFRVRQDRDYISDFDKEISRITEKKDLE